MKNWIKKQWQNFEENSDKKLKQYLESITLKDAKPCPFCGETTIRCFDHKTALIGGLKIYNATCSGCGATIGRSLSKESVQRKWNQRTGEKQ